MRAALTARTRSQLDQLLTDLPDSVPRRSGQVGRGSGGAVRRAGFAITFKSSIRRSGRWRGTRALHGRDLQGHRLAGPARGRAGGPGDHHRGGRLQVAGGHPGTAGESGSRQAASARPPARTTTPCRHRFAPVVHVRGFAYKGTIEARSSCRTQQPTGTLTELHDHGVFGLIDPAIFRDHGRRTGRFGRQSGGCSLTRARWQATVRWQMTGVRWRCRPVWVWQSHGQVAEPRSSG